MAERIARALAGRLRELRTGLTSLPGRAGWLESAAWTAALVVLAAPLAWAGGLVDVAGGHAAASVRTLLLPFLVPALVEECLFRGLLVPHPSRSPLPLARRARWWAGSLAAYVAAHPLVAATVRPGARGIVDTPPFLLEAALLGVVTTALYHRTGSLWPGVLVHGALVAVWLSLGGAALLSG